MDKKLYISQIDENLDGDTHTNLNWNCERSSWAINTFKEICGKLAAYGEEFTEEEMDRMTIDRIAVYCNVCNKAFKYLEEEEDERING